MAESRMIELEKKLDELIKQRDQARDFFLKCQVAIEVIEQMINEETSFNGQVKDDANKKVKQVEKK